MSDTSNPITHVFDQTNGVVEGLEGESDGTVTGGSSSVAERDGTDGVPGDDRPQAYDGPRDTSTVPLRDSDDDATGRAGGDTTASTAAATAGAQAPADQEESGVEHTFAVDRAGAATDEGPTSDDAGADAAEYGSATEPIGSEAGDDDTASTGISQSSAASRETASSYDEGRADAARVTATATAVPVQRDDEGVTTADAYDRGPAAEVGSNDRDDEAGEDAATTAVAASSIAEPADAGSDGRSASDVGSDGTAASDAGSDGRTAPSSLAALIGDDSIGHVFDQTNGVIDGIDGDSDGTAESDEESPADRRGMNEPNPVGQQDAFHDDHYGATDGRDPNP